VLSRPARPIRTLHLDDVVLLVAKCLSGFTHFVITLSRGHKTTAHGKTGRSAVQAYIRLNGTCEALLCGTEYAGFSHLDSQHTAHPFFSPQEKLDAEVGWGSVRTSFDQRYIDAPIPHI
jgi:hypothetical protein